MKITAQTWKAQREEAARRSAAVDKIMPPYVRTRPRDAEEAAILRRRGVPESLIGPSLPAARPRDVSARPNSDAKDS